MKSILLVALLSFAGIASAAPVVDAGVDLTVSPTISPSVNTIVAPSISTAVNTAINPTINPTISTAVNVSPDIRNTNANSASVDSSNVQGQIQGQGQKQSTSNANNSTNTSTVTIAGDNFEAKRIPVNTAFAPSVAPTANCALSVSGGISTIGFRGSFGKAYIDENCATLERVRNVALVLGDIETAEAMLCQDAKYAKARLTAGRACPVEQE